MKCTINEYPKKVTIESLECGEVFSNCGFGYMRVDGFFDARNHKVVAIRLTGDGYLDYGSSDLQVVPVDGEFIGRLRGGSA